VFERIIEL
jgi:E3 ubiquitin-protein ligase synoviolin